MTFLHPERLAFLLMAALPIAFHLYQRFAMRRRVLPTFRFLAHRSVAEERRRRIRRYLLLACRVLALILAALAWARPVAREEARQLTNERTQLVIVVDRSLSMQAVVAGQSRFATAVAEARELVEHAPAGTLLTLIAFDSAAEIVQEAQDDPARVLEALRNLRPTRAGTNLAAGVMAARAVLLANGGAGRLALLADLQRDGSDAALTGALRGVAARLVFSDRLLAPARGNRGVGAMTIEASAGELQLAVHAAGGAAGFVKASSTGPPLPSEAGPDRLRWRLTIPELSWEREAVAEHPVFVLPRAAREAETLAFIVTLTGGDILAADDVCTATAHPPRPIPVFLRAEAAARPYLAAALEAIGVRAGGDPAGSVIIGDESALEATASTARGAIIFSGPSTSSAEGAWTLRGDGALAVPGLGRGRFTRRAALSMDSATSPLLRFSDGAPAAVESRLTSNAPLIRFGFAADRSSSDLVLTAAFPLLVRAALNRLGAGGGGAITERDPDVPPEESDLGARPPSAIAALLAPDANAPLRTVRIADEPRPDRWTPLLLAGVLFLLLAEMLLGKKAR